MESHAAAQAFERAYLRGDSRVAEVEFARLKKEFSATGRLDLEARAELLRCALRTASLEFDDCPGFETLRAYAGPEELAYADFLSGKTTRLGSDDALGRLVNFGVRFRTGTTNPSEIKAAVDLSSEQGWRRPLLAWLGVEAKRAEAAGDRDTLERIRRRMAFVSGTYR